MQGHAKTTANNVIFFHLLAGRGARVLKELLPPVALHGSLALVCDQAGALTQTDRLSLENKSQADPGGGGVEIRRPPCSQ